MVTARRCKSPHFLRRLLGFALRMAGGILVLTVLLVLPLRWVPPLTSSFMLQNAWEHKGDSGRLRYAWVSRKKISWQAPLAVLAAEDQKFFRHHGFDLESIRKVWQRQARGRKIRGASTLSQQVAKNLWLWPARSWFRKGLEAWLTLWIEVCWPKERILEVYLNIAQFGPQIFGVEAASRQYFRKSAKSLHGGEAAALAAVLPSPQRYRVNNGSGYMQRRKAWIRRQAPRLVGELPKSDWSG